MYSNLVKTNYEIKDMKLQDLRNRIIQENNLTPLEILKGFHEKSEVELRYQSTLTEQEKKDTRTIEDEYIHYIKNIDRKSIQQLYDKEFETRFQECKTECPEITLSDIIDYNNGKELPVLISNASNRLLRKLSNINEIIKRKIKNEATEYINKFINDNYGEKYKVTESDKTFDNFCGLPHKLKVNVTPDIDFSKVYEYCDNSSRDFEEMVVLEYDSKLGCKKKIKYYKYDIINILVHLSEEKAKDLFNNAINSIIYKNNSAGELEYFQNLEAKPITININTKTDKYELIDGYKRLLYISDENLLQYSAPIRIFTDLTDYQFLALLYASNMWKSKDIFHDRGFLFALKTRFNFEIPLNIYGNFNRNELNILQLYDFGDELAKANKNIIMNTLNRHKYSVSDIKMLYDFVPQEAEKHNEYDKNMSEEIMFTIIEQVGNIRRKIDNDIQNELSENLIIEIFEDNFIKKACSKKHLSTRTYVQNYFRDKGLYNRIIKLLNERLINN